MQVTTCFRISKCLWNRRSSINFHDRVIIAAALSCRIVLSCLQQQIHHHYNLLSLRAEVCRLPDCKSYQNRSCGLLVVQLGVLGTELRKERTSYPPRKEISFFLTMKYLSVFLCTSCLIHAFQDDDHKDISWNIFCRHVVKRICFRRIVLYSANGAASFNLFSLQIILGDDIRSKLGLKTKVRRKSTTKMDARNQRSETISSEYSNSSIRSLK